MGPTDSSRQSPWPPPTVPFLPPSPPSRSPGAQPVAPPFLAPLPPHPAPAPWIAPLSTRRRRRTAPFVVAGLLAVVVGTVVVVRATHGRAEHPDAWDPRVAEIAAFVERERGLTFDHPVWVTFLAPDEYAVEMGEETIDVSPADREYYDDVAEVANATGLAVGYDPLAAQSTIMAAGTLGLYDPYTDQVFVRGDDLGPAVRVTIAHELTHALQAQHFDLDRGEIGFVFRSVVEADAQRVEQVYYESLAAGDRTEVDDFYADADLSALDTVPWALIETFNAPYVLGPNLVDAAFEDGGNVAVDRLLRRTPTEEVLISPWLAGTREGMNEAHLALRAPDSAEVIEPPRALGMWETLVMLDAWLPWTIARTALDGWDGGGYVSYAPRSGPAACFDAAISVDGDPQPLADAITAWADASGSDATPEISGHEVRFTACSRGDDAAEPDEPLLGPLGAAAVEAQAVRDLTGDGVTTEAVLCVARALIDDPAVAPLFMLRELDPDQQRTFDRARDAAHTGCRIAT